MLKGQNKSPNLTVNQTQINSEEIMRKLENKSEFKQLFQTNVMRQLANTAEDIESRRKKMNLIVKQVDLTNALKPKPGRN